jgi:hypothetical protein
VACAGNGSAAWSTDLFGDRNRDRPGAPPGVSSTASSDQMRWSRRGADLLLQVRCAVYNGMLGSEFEQKFHPANDCFPPAAIAPVSRWSRVLTRKDPNSRCFLVPPPPESMSRRATAILTAPEQRDANRRITLSIQTAVAWPDRAADV